MDKRKATIYDFARMCDSYSNCSDCPLRSLKKAYQDCRAVIVNALTEANEIILEWCDDHPNETRQSEFLKQFPKTQVVDGVISLCPAKIMGENYCASVSTVSYLCDKCKKEYWLKERD